MGTHRPPLWETLRVRDSLGRRGDPPPHSRHPLGGPPAPAAGTPVTVPLAPGRRGLSPCPHPCCDVRWYHHLGQMLQCANTGVSGARRPAGRAAAGPPRAPRILLPGGAPQARRRASSQAPGAAARGARAFSPPTLIPPRSGQPAADRPAPRLCLSFTPPFLSVGTAGITLAQIIL